MDQFISDPEKYKSNAVARVIKIKNEADIERHLGIKKERKNSGDCIPAKKSVTVGKIEKFKAEKGNFITEIVSLKSENRQLTFRLNEQKIELAANEMEYSTNVCKLNQKIAQISSDLKKSKSEITKLTANFLEEKAKDKKLIDKLVSEKKQLSARVKQLQSCSLLNKTQNDDGKNTENLGDENEYEVDKLIADEMDGKTRYYLVRWKGFGREDDTWEEEKNLSCPIILEEYNKQKLK